MILGIIGQGPWSKVYAKTLEVMGISYWQSGKGWRMEPKPDGIIIASSPESHYWVARELLRNNMPIIIEKPICLRASHARQLLQIAQLKGGIVYDGHTRLYSPAWRAFKASLPTITDVFINVRGGDWGPHWISMCLDIGFDPLCAAVLVDQDQPLSVTVNGVHSFIERPESPTPLEVLIDEFTEAISKLDPNYEGLRRGVMVVDILEQLEARGAQHAHA